MLFAVEGGGFFSSSASGYSKGLALLLLGQRNEEKPIRVSPWNQYQLVEQGVGSKQPVSKKKQPSCGCTSFICFGCKSRGSDGLSDSKLGSVQKSETSPGSSDSSDRDKVRNSDSADESDVKMFLKSSLKKSSSVNCSLVVENGEDRDNSLQEAENNVSCTDRRKIHWTDAHGKELAEIREFEPSELGASDEEFEHEGARRCQCVIQ
ncbi:uncharacterized protein A4U43_C08F6050 [Asparagus officinalis]|uniref:uncharacterized protein LOC109851433 n=1 Tax=Asparagus officinalis TaxID=4686 RepID=UPI00098E7AF7|nr:uncharacterized protein LOC109851433 [Asparagus officinalis]ONK59401.1 uncharacterized protein A4U43_C08F6050 [Asparagus officinalis]